MNLFEYLKEKQRTVTGAAGAAIASVLSLPHATINGLASAVHGKSFDEASTAVMAKYAEVGRRIGREQSDEIVHLLMHSRH